MRTSIPKVLYSLSTAVVLAVSSPASAGLLFNLSDTGNAQANAGFQKAGEFWSSIFTDNITVNINTGFSALNPGILGQASSTIGTVSFSAMKTSLANDATSADDNTMVTGLSSGNSYSKLINGTLTNSSPHLHTGITDVRMTSANAKALGLLAANNVDDASITFSNQFNWDFDQSDGIGAGLIDFVGVAIHELGHAMGFTSGVDILDNDLNFNHFSDTAFDPFATVLDFTRCSSASETAGADMDWTANNNAKNFAINGACSGADLVTNAWSTGVNQGDGRQASHWKDGLGLGILDPTSAPAGSVNIVTSLDIQALDVIGWDLAQVQQVPEPTGLLLFCTGIFGLGMMRRKN